MAKDLLENTKIPLIIGDMYEFFKKGYTGGSVDVYQATGENIYRYDVNSLYPFVMKNFSMPVGNPVYFEGDILFFNKKNYRYSVCFCSIEIDSCVIVTRPGE